MDAATQRAIASKGGKAAHLSGNAHKFSSEEAREAGRKGGQAAHRSSGASNSRNAGKVKEDEYEAADDTDDSDDSEDPSLREDSPLPEDDAGNRAQLGDQSGSSGYGEAVNEARGRGRDRGNNQGDGKPLDYQAQGTGRNQGRNNIYTAQERQSRSSQGRSHKEGGDG
jgi:hypothetical protein